jgi:hypothetical protein
LTGSAQVQAAVLKADAHCLSQSPWASCEVDQGCLAAAKSHEMKSIQRLKSA